MICGYRRPARLWAGQSPTPPPRPRRARCGFAANTDARDPIARRARSISVPLLLAGVALAFDAADRRVPFNVLATGLLDEPAHLATAALGLLALACFIDAPRRFYVAGMIASVAIDLDHIPVYLGLLGNPDQRPVTHSLTIVMVIATAAAVSCRHRAVLAGCVAGLLIHFARDIAEGPPGVRMLWPIRDTAWTASFWWFLAMVITFTAVRLIFTTTGIPRGRIRLFQAPASSTSHSVRRSADSRRPGRTDRDRAALGPRNA